MQIISILSTVVIAILILMNFQELITVNLLSERLAQLLNLPPYSLNLNTAIYTLIIFILGEVSAIFFFAPLYTSLKEKFNAYKRELERGAISNTNGEAKIKVLENKIAVLEKALEDALKKKN